MMVAGQLNMTDAVPPEVLLVEEHTRPIATFTTVLKTGSLDDPPGKEGLSYLTGQMLTRGAGGLSQADFTEQIDFLGSSFSVAVGRHHVTLSGDGLIRNLDALEALVSKVFRTPNFAQEELDKLKRRTVNELLNIRDNDSALAQRSFVRTLFDGHPYSRPLKGTLGSLESITVDDIRQHFERFYRSPGAILGAVGDVTQARTARFMENTLGALPGGVDPHRNITKLDNPESCRLTIVDKPERTQTQVYIGQTTLHANHPDYLAVSVGNIIFGGTFTARLSQEIREKRGWSYGAYSYIHSDQYLGSFLMRFSPAVADTLPALELADSLFTQFVTNGVTDEEVAFAKRYLTNSHPFIIDTSEKRLQEMVSCRLVDRPLSWIDTYLEKVSALSTDDINTALVNHLAPDRLQFSLLATAQTVEENLRGWNRLKQVDIVDYRSE